MHERSPTEDEVTIPRDVEAVPGVVETEDETTVPVDVEEMELAAKKSRSAPDPTERPRILRRAVGTGDDSRAVGTVVEVAGAAEVIPVAEQRVSETGASLTLPDGVDPSLPEGASVQVRFQVDGMPTRLPAVVAFCRAPSGGRPGGVSVRWDAPRNVSTRRVAGIVARIRASDPDD